MLVAHGEADDAWLPHVQADMAQRLGARHEVINNSIHSPAVENPPRHAGGAARLLGRPPRRGRDRGPWRPCRRRRWTAEEDRLGFFGPDSVTWRIHTDPTYSVGGLRALLLQALHPVAMDGVAAFSGGFRDEPWPRLIRTGQYVDTLTFGTRTEAPAAVAAGCAASTGGSVPTEETTGRAYRVDDPDLLLWVHCCEVDSLLSHARRAGLPLTDDDADRYVAGAGDRRDADRGADGATCPGLGRRASTPTSRRSGRRWRSPRRRGTAYRLIVLPPMPGWVQLLTPARPAWGTLASLGARDPAARGPGGCTRCPGSGSPTPRRRPALRAFRQATARGAGSGRAGRRSCGPGWPRVTADAADLSAGSSSARKLQVSRAGAAA